MRRSATLLIMGATIILATVLAATGPVSAASVSVEITDEGFNPSAVTIPPHSSVTWTNRGSQSHSVVGESGNALGSPDLAPRFRYSYTFHSTGTYFYYDATTELRGVVIVLEGMVPLEPVLTTPPPETSSPLQATPITSGQPAVLHDNPTGGGTRQPLRPRTLLSLGIRFQKSRSHPHRRRRAPAARARRPCRWGTSGLAILHTRMASSKRL